MFSTSRLFVVVLVAGSAIGQSASGATVSYTLDLTGPAGTFILSASASGIDNSGIAGYGIPLTGPILTVDHRSPNAITSVTLRSVGFTTTRTVDGNSTLLGRQPDRPNPQITGFGQTGSNWTAKLGGPPLGSSDSTSDNPWFAPLVIATGTYNSSQGAPGFGLGVNLFANVYAIGDTSTRMSAIVNAKVILGPRGDYNNSGVVDAADYVLWRQGGPLMNDATPGVQSGDYDEWRAHFGESAAASAATRAVPEPATWLLAIGATSLLTIRRRF